MDFRATDIRIDLQDYSVPTLVLLPDFNETVPEYGHSYLVSAWDEFRERAAIFSFETVRDAHVMLWLDNPSGTYGAISQYLDTQPNPAGH